MRPPATVGRSSPTDTTTIDTHRASIPRHCPRKQFDVKQRFSRNYILCLHALTGISISQTSRVAARRAMLRKRTTRIPISTLFN
jgi:hypothetical protein